jgi:hypothetical protein
MHRLSGWRRTRRTRRTAGSLLLAGLTAAVVVALPGTGTARTDVANPAPGPAAAWDRDALKVAATKDVPTFGGSYLDDDGSTLHVWLTRPTADDALRSRAALATGVGNRAPVVHRADYTFAQLKQWRDATRALLALPGVTMLDIDERTNRLVVGVEDTGRDGPAVTAGLARLAVPRAAVTLTRAGPVTQSLGDRNRPLGGGVKIRHTSGFCSLGFIAQRAGVSGFVTNSHCSVTSGSVDSGKYWQPDNASSGDTVGVETVDPAFSTASPCPVGRKCRKSDANFVATVAGVGIGQGQIARPPLNSATWNGTDTFRIVAVRNAQLPTTVQKVGHVTGRTEGKVTADCLDLKPAGTTITLFCQDMASYSVKEGDSGSPVFEVINTAANTVALVGIHWGIGTNSLGELRGFYSPFSGVEAELGNLSVCSDATVC